MSWQGKAVPGADLALGGMLSLECLQGSGRGWPRAGLSSVPRHGRKGSKQQQHDRGAMAWLLGIAGAAHQPLPEL